MEGKGTFNVLRSEEPHILVVETEKWTTRKVNGVFKVITAEGEIEALKKLIEPFPRAVLIGMEITEGSALSLCRSIKQNSGTSLIPVILIANDFTEEAEINGLSAGANDVISQASSEELVTLRIDRLVERLGKYYHRSSFLEKVDQILFKNLQFESFHVEELAVSLHMDRKTLYRRIKKDSGLTPQIYIRNMRISRAGHLLKRGTMTISEVAFQVGFLDVSYFSKCFKDYFKRCPSEFVNGHFGR